MIICELDYMMFERLCRTAAYFDNDNDDYISLLYDVYENSNIKDSAAFFDNLFQYTKYYKNIEELISDYSLENYIVYYEHNLDKIDIEETYNNIKDNYDMFEIYGDEERDYIKF